MNKRLFAFSAVVAFGLCSALAQGANLTITANGTLDPKISGSDPLGAAGGSGVVTLTISETAKPTKKTATSATYRVPAGGLVATVGSTTVKSNAPANLKFTVPRSGADIIYVSGTFTYDGIKGTITATLDLAPKSFTKAILKHPTTFSPASQALTAATTATGPGSKGSYKVFGGTTVLGLSGTVTASSN